MREPVILLVDDEEFPLLPMQWQICQMGYRVLTVTDGEQALSQLTSQPVDLVISD